MTDARDLPMNRRPLIPSTLSRLCGRAPQQAGAEEIAVRDKPAQLLCFGLGRGAWMIASVLVGMLASACDASDPGPSYGQVEFGTPSAPPQGAVLSKSQITVPEGMAVRSTPVPLGQDGVRLKGEVSGVEVEAEDSSVLGVYPGPNAGEVVLLGASLGTTRVFVTIQGVVVDVIPAQVVEQLPD